MFKEYEKKNHVMRIELQWASYGVTYPLNIVVDSLDLFMNNSEVVIVFFGHILMEKKIYKIQNLSKNVY